MVKRLAAARLAHMERFAPLSDNSTAQVPDSKQQEKLERKY